MHFTVQDVDLLRAGPWFAALPQALQELILANSGLRSYRKGEVITREGEPAKGMGAVLDGQVHLTRNVGNRADALVGVGHAGFWFGIYGTLSGGRPSIGGLVAATPVRALFLPLPAFERIVADEPRYYRMVAGILLHRFASLHGHLAVAKGLAPEERLRERLLELARSRGDGGGATGSVALDVSQAELAKLVGLSRQTVSTLLGRLEARGLVDIGFRRVRVLV